MARTRPQGLCCQMCQEWWPCCSAGSLLTVVGTGRLSRGCHQWLDSSDTPSGGPEIQTVAVDGFHGFSCNRHERICLCRCDILGCLPVHRRSAAAPDVWDVTGRSDCAIVSVTVTSLFVYMFILFLKVRVGSTFCCSRLTALLLGRL